MADVLTAAQRSHTMSRIKGTKTGPELRVKKALKALSFEFQPRGIYGRPDFANRAAKVAVFIDGCFWHKCPKHYKKPKSNKAYWAAKIKKNTSRDIMVNRRLQRSGWRVIRVWEHSITPETYRGN